MAIQAQFCLENLGFPLGRVPQNYVESGYGLISDRSGFNLQQQQQLRNLQQRNQNLFFQNNGLVQTTNNQQCMVFSQSIDPQMENQRQEFDQFITTQNDGLRMALLEQRKKQLATMMQLHQPRAEVLLRQKDEEIAKAMNRRLELENVVRGIELDSQTWQRLAKQNEAMVISLNNSIEKLRETAFLSSNGVAEDAESSCVFNNDIREKRGGFQENEEGRTRKTACKSCGSGNSCVIFLPCRHLGSCKACEAFLDSCLICGMMKKNSIEALF